MRVLFIDARFKPNLFGTTTVDYAKSMTELEELTKNNYYDVVSIGNEISGVDTPMAWLTTQELPISIFNFHGTNKDKIETMIKYVNTTYKDQKVDIYTMHKRYFVGQSSIMTFVNGARTVYNHRELIEGDHILIQKDNLFYKVYPDVTIKFNQRKPDKQCDCLTRENFIPEKLVEGYEVLINPFTDLTNFTKVRRL